MATIDYKEKYEQALERARQFSEKPYLEDSAGIVEYIFPELKESEDERIRKGIIRNLEYLMDRAEGFVKDELKERIAWLEKQGKKTEQNPKWKGVKDLEAAILAAHPTFKQKPDDKVDQHSLPVSDNNSLPTFDESIYHPCTESVHEQESSEWSEEDELTRNALINLVEMYYGGCIDKSEKNRLLNFLKSLKDRYTWKLSDKHN